MADQKNDSAKTSSASSCGCVGGKCDDMSRRDFLRVAGTASAAVAAGSVCCGEETTSTATARRSPHLIPADKKLAARWLKSLQERGTPVVWRGEELKTIGMPVGGIGTGQLYLCGDGTLGHWEIFNKHEFLGVGGRSYARRTIYKPVRHGIALRTRAGDKQDVRMLDETGFTDVSFRGEYPIGTISYADSGTAVAATLEAFSPFIPLNEKDSGLPATFMIVNVENKGKTSAEVSLLSWLENPVAKTAGEYGWSAKRRTRIVRDAAGARIVHSAAPTEETARPTSGREPILFATFEGEGFGQWKAEGDAFPNPATGKIGTQQEVVGFGGQQLINSFIQGDSTTGTVTSPEFTIDRKYINFMIGGGADNVGIRLVVDGNEVRKGSGKNSEQLQWRAWNVGELEGKKAHLVIFDSSKDGWGHVLVDEIEFSDTPRREVEFSKFEDFPDFGSMTWCCVEETLSASDAGAAKEGLPESLADLEWSDALEFEITERNSSGLTTKPITLSLASPRSFTSCSRGTFPTHSAPSARRGTSMRRGLPTRKPWRSTRWRIASGSSATRASGATPTTTTLPYWLLDRLHSTASMPGDRHLPVVGERPVLGVGRRGLLRRHLHARVELRAGHGAAVPRAGAQRARDAGFRRSGFARRAGWSASAATTSTPPTASAARS